MENFIQTVTDVNNVINDFVWVKLGIAILLGTGIHSMPAKIKK